MMYRVVLAPSFQQDIDNQIKWLLSQGVAATTIETWLARLYSQIASLEEQPNRHPVDVTQSAACGNKTRKLISGAHLVFYQVNNEKTQIDVVAFVHGATRDATDHE